MDGEKETALRMSRQANTRRALTTEVPVIHEEFSAPRVNPSTEQHDDTVEAHYACLERACACLEGWVFVGYIDEHGEEREASYRCRRCFGDESR